MKRKDKNSFIPFFILPLLLIAPNSLPGLLCVISQLGHSNPFKYAAACIKNLIKNIFSRFCLNIDWFNVPAFYDFKFSNSQLTTVYRSSSGPLQSEFEVVLAKMFHEFSFLIKQKQQKWPSMIFTPFYFPMIYVSSVAFLHPHTLSTTHPTHEKKMPAPPSHTHRHTCHSFDANPFLYFWG